MSEEGKQSIYARRNRMISFTQEELFATWAELKDIRDKLAKNVEGLELSLEDDYCVRVQEIKLEIDEQLKELEVVMHDDFRCYIDRDIFVEMYKEKYGAEPPKDAEGVRT